MDDAQTALLDRAAGVLLAQAVGDALGVPYEFAPPFDGPARMVGGGLGPYAPGEWSDDTQMSVCVARVAATGTDLTSDAALDAVADGFLAWLTGGASDVGAQTRQVLTTETPGPGSAANLRARSAQLHDLTGRTAGNGALMRTGVVGLTALHDRERTAAAARAVALLTHADDLAGDSCVLWSEAVRVAVLDARLDLLGGLDLLPPDRRDAWQTRIEDATGADPALFAPNGFTVTALQAAWAAITTTTAHDGTRHLPDALQAAVHAGDDTDTVAAIAGALLGARWGASAVPSDWRTAVHGWPGLTGEDLVDLGRRAARAGCA
ncbi:ADP-ribosylglycohydrolase family protein [Cellulomonas fimi]|uniref:ADP-ribosylglycohydrolase family protein n=1 Tax=Cellulomonas fimi TaxID=1708 RepID=UPI0002FC3516|nr:ADP-ribosylglycohydrolase family protein [Cellulomonas fimi]